MSTIPAPQPTVGQIELDGSGRQLVIRFAYRAELVNVVRALPGRTFDRDKKLWKVPSEHVAKVVATLAPLGFVLASEVVSIVGDVPPTPTTTPPLSSLPFAAAPTNDALTVSALNQRVRGALQGAFPESLWVVGEVMNFDKSAGRQHRFFTLVEKTPGDEARPLAQIEAALFERTIELLERKLRAADPPLQLRDGLQIRVLARVDLYPATGRYQLVIDDVDPTYTLGQLALNREQILRELRAQGLEHTNLNLRLPTPALRLGVLASPTSDGWNDFVRHLQAAPFAWDVTLFPVRVQGVTLRQTVGAGLRWFAHAAARFDALCILRGGGSRTELSWWDDRELAFAVAQHPLKILVGIGHERDRTVLDCIAQSFKTPTAVAAFLVDCAEGVRARLDEAASAVIEACLGRLASANSALHTCAVDIRHALRARLAGEHERLGLDRHRLVRGSAHRFARQRDLLQRAAERATRGVATRLERATASLERQATRQRLLDPRAVLRRGFAMVRGDDGRIVTDARQLALGAGLDVEFRDGVVAARTERVTIRPADEAP